jgi:protein ImuB
MRRVMLLSLPRWPIDRRRQRQSALSANGTALPEGPLALAISVGTRRLIAAVDDAAEALGLAPGLPLTDARARYPALAVAEADPVGDAAALQRLAQWCRRYSPWTAPMGSDGIALDITGCAHLQGGEAALRRGAVERLERQGIAARAAIADTLGAAWALARCGPGGVVPPGGACQALAVLPIAALRLDGVAAAELERLGLRRIGDLYALPRAALAARFGDGVALRLDQALGAAAEPLSPLPPAPMRWARRRFAEPIVTPEAVAAAVDALLETLCRGLGEEALGARRLTLACHRVDGEVADVAIGTARPSRERLHLQRLLAERLETIDPGLGIEDMVLTATAVERLAAAQIEIQTTDERRICRLSSVGRRPELAELVDRLANRLGEGAVGGLRPRASHLPERAQRFAPVFAEDAGAWRSGRTQPVRLLVRPEPIEAVAPVPDDPPILFRWRRVAHRVRRADGPERLCGEWWRDAEEADRLRDYYRIEDEEGRRFWLFRDGLYRPKVAPRWFLHGVFP